MGNDLSPEVLAELAVLRDRVRKQEEELAALRDEAPGGASRRALFKGAGALAGGLALATAVGGGKVAALERAPGVDVPLSGGPIALFLKANGSPVEGDSTREQTEGAIDCLSFDSTVRVLTREDRFSTGRRVHEGIAFRKRIDKSTPLLAKALCNNEVIEGIFKFFRPNVDGQAEHYFSVELKNGRVAVLELVSPDGFSNGSGQAPHVEPFDDVTFVYQTIKWTYEPGGVEFEDTWSQQV